jgi:hypothetical protein
MTCTSSTITEYLAMNLGAGTDVTSLASVYFDEPVLIRHPKVLNRMLWRIAPPRKRCRMGASIHRLVPRILPRGRIKAREQIARGIV